LYKDAVATSPPSAATGAPGVPAWAWAPLLLALGFVYLRGIASHPLVRDELRPALVSEEMIHRGDFTVPRLLGEPDASQPPLHSWLIVLGSFGRASRVGPLTVRLPSVLAVAATALVLARLGLSAQSGPHVLPALVFLTFAVLPRYGRNGEPDLVAAFWGTAALAAFELGRRRGSSALQWIVAQALLAGAILTQAVAAVFFHGPAVLTTWRRRLRLQPLALAAGAVLMLALVLAWLALYARTAPASAFRAQLSAEIARHTTVTSASDALRHVPRSLLPLLLTAAPGSLVLLALVVPRARAALRGLLGDPWLALCGFTSAWAVLWIVVLPGTQPGELITALPAVATLVAAALARIDRPARALWPWAVVAAAWASVIVLGPRVAFLAPPEPRAPALAAAVVGFGLIAIAAATGIARAFGTATAALLVAGVLYGLFTVRDVDAYAVKRHTAFVATAQALAPHLRPELPVVVRRGIDRELTWLLAHQLERPLLARAPAPPYDLVTRGSATVPNARFMLESGGYSVWRVRVPHYEGQ
jgi:4-amino-4-deoxy-L-arabinose transferase-like glycosyltransferase